MIDISIVTMLPFFFVLAIVYGALEVSDVFKNRGVKVIISLVIAFFSITSPVVITLVTSLLPYAAIFFISFFFLGFVLSFLKQEENGKKKVDFTLLIVILALVLMFLTSPASTSIIDFQDQNFLAMIVTLIIALILYSAYRTKSTS